MTNAQSMDLGGKTSLAVKSSWITRVRAAIEIVRLHVGILAVLVFAVCFLSPMLWTGFYFDDVKNSCTAGQLRLIDASVSKLFLDCTRAAMHHGRFFPGALGLTFFMHDLLTNALAYKIYLLVLILSNLLEFYCLLRCCKVSRPVAQLGTLTLVLLMQMRAFPDPLLSFAGIMQFVAGQMMLSMILLQKHLELGRGKWLAASVTIFVSSLVTYEISYAFLPIYAVMAYAHCRHWRPALAILRPYILAVLILTTFVLGLRFNVPMPEGFVYRLSLEPWAVAATTFKQASAALPLSYGLLSLHHPLYFDGWRAVCRWDSWLVALFACVLTWAFARRIPMSQAASKRPAIGVLFAMGGMVWLLAGVPTSLSSKYQAGVQMGLGYLPVYVQYCGVAMLIVAGLTWLAGRVPTHRVLLVVGLVPVYASVALFSFDTNRHVTGVLEESPSIFERRILEAALNAGLGDGIPDGATIMSTRGTPHGVLRSGPPIASSFISQHVQRKVNAVSGVTWPGERSLNMQLDGLPLPTFILRWRSDDGLAGYALLGSIDPETADLEAEKFDTRTYRLFVRGTPNWSAEESNDPQLDASHLKLLRSGPDWALYEGQLRQAVDLATVERSAVSAVLCRAGNGVESR